MKKIKVALILRQPHVPIVMRLKIELAYPLVSTAYNQVMLAASDLRQNCTVSVMHLNSTFGPKPPVEVSVEIGNVMLIKVQSNFDLDNAIVLFFRQISANSAVPKELQVRVSAPPAFFTISPVSPSRFMECLDANQYEAERNKLVASTIPITSITPSQENPMASPSSSICNFVSAGNASVRSHRSSCCSGHLSTASTCNVSSPCFNSFIFFDQLLQQHQLIDQFPFKASNDTKVRWALEHLEVSIASLIQILELNTL